jgi:hypothetical protein
MVYLFSGLSNWFNLSGLTLTAIGTLKAKMFYGFASGATFGFSYIMAMRGAWDLYSAIKGMSGQEQAQRFYDTLDRDWETKP